LNFHKRSTTRKGWRFHLYIQRARGRAVKGVDAVAGNRSVGRDIIADSCSGVDDAGAGHGSDKRR